MSRKEKVIERLKLKPKDFTYDEVKQVLNIFEFIKHNKGKTSGSKVIFKNELKNIDIALHKPHPNNIIKPYQINEIIKILKEMEDF